MVSPRRNDDGFTLIEMTIVLVVIALIIGGILLGQDMINAAKIRQQIGQFEKWNAAVNAFETKYNCLPGDCLNATSYGFLSANAGYNGNGNGDGRISCAVFGGGAGSTCQWTMDDRGENANFWYQLVQANLIPSTLCTNLSCTTSYAAVGQYTPQPIIASVYNTGFAILSTNDYNPNSAAAYQLLSNNAYYSVQNFIQNSGVLRNFDVLSIDIKIDDGYPVTGIVRALTTGGGLLNASPSFILMGASCVNTGTTPNTYVNSLSFNCKMIVQAPF